MSFEKPELIRGLAVFACGICLFLPVAAQGNESPAFLPGTRYRVHDLSRPRPPRVLPTTGRDSTPAPTDAVVLFDGSDLTAFTGRDGKASWRLVDGAMEVNQTGDIETREHFEDFHLHVEWCAPTTIRGEGQGRGNSGIFLCGRYEVQVLDSSQSDTYPDGQAAALYGQYPPLVNACAPPGTWQTYDIFFRAPRFEGGQLVRPARVTVIHNGLPVHLSREFLGPTVHKALPEYRPHSPKGPIRLQDHGDPVRYRNLWIRPLPAE